MVKRICLFLLSAAACLGQPDPGVDPAYLSNFLPSAGGFPDYTNTLMAWWKMDEGTGTSLADSTGHGNTGSFAGTSPSWVTGSPVNNGSAVNLPSASSRIEVSGTANNRLHKNFTVTWWVTRTNAGNIVPAEGFFGRGSGASSQVASLLVASGSGVVQYQAYGNSQNGAAAFNNQWPWTWFAYSYDGATLFGWTNGILYKQATVTAVEAGNDADPWEIGNTASALANFNGSICEMRMYTNALYQDHIWDLWAHYGGTNQTYSSLIVNDWSNRVVVAGGASPSAGTISALSTFVSSLSQDEIWRKMIVINAFVPDNLTAAITPLIVGTGFNPWSNTNFVSGDLSVNGLAGNGTDKLLNTGIVPSSTYALTSVGMTSYVYNNGTNAGIDGAWDATYDKTFRATYGGGSVTWDCPNDGADSGSIKSSCITNGYFSFNRTAINVNKAYEARSDITHTNFGNNAKSVNAGRIPITPIFVFAGNANGNGTPFDYSTHTLSFWAIHLGLTQLESSNLFNRVQTLRTNLGGGYR